MDGIAEKILNSLDACIFLMSSDGKIIYGNDAVARAMGFKERDDIVGITYAEQKCKAAERSDVFIAQNNLAIERLNPVKILTYDCYADNIPRVMFGTKSPYLDHTNTLQGVAVNLFDVTDINLIDIGRFLMKGSKRYAQSRDNFFNFYIEQVDKQFELSNRELETLFLTLRGKTAKEIAQILDISSKTVESYISNIKVKFNCTYRSELFEKAYHSGYMNIFPDSLLKNEKFIKHINQL